MRRRVPAHLKAWRPHIPYGRQRRGALGPRAVGRANLIVGIGGTFTRSFAPDDGPEALLESRFQTKAPFNRRWRGWKQRAAIAPDGNSGWPGGVDCA
jgi:hypothetical protein